MSRVGPSRRCLLASLAFLSLSGYLLAGLAPGVGCPNDNPFIVIMKKDGVQLYDTPKQVSHICKAEFETYGTCCNETMLVEYANNDYQQMVVTHRKLIMEFKKLITSNKKLVSTVKEISEIKEHGGNKKILRVIEKANALKISQPFKVLQEQFGTMTEEDVVAFSEKNLKCWTRLTQERSASICATCSGRSSHFFHKDKILITEHKCLELADVCEAPMKVITQLVIGIIQMEKISRTIAEAGIQISSGSRSLQMKPLQGLSKIVSTVSRKVGETVHKVIHKIGSIVLRHDAKTWANFLQADNSGADSIGLASDHDRKINLCGKFVKMREPIMLEDMEKIVKQMIQFDFEAAPFLKQYISGHSQTAPNQTWSDPPKKSGSWYPIVSKAPRVSHEQKTATTQSPHQWKVGNRVLQFATTDNIGSDAEIVIVTDSSYSSVGVSGHGPMADDLQFP